MMARSSWFCVDAAAGRLEPEGEAEGPEIIIVSDAVEGTFVDLDGKSLREEQKENHQREWKRSEAVDRTEMRKEEKRSRCALLSMVRSEYRKEVHEKVQRAQTEAGGSGGTVQQRGQGRMEVCSERSKNH